MRFYVGLHQPSDAPKVGHWCIHIERLARRRKSLGPGTGLVDSRAFQKVALEGGYSEPPAAYAEQINGVVELGQIDGAVSQDYMCEPTALAATGLSIPEHQALTIERYVQLLAARPRCYVMPVLQGYAPSEYVAHLRAYGRLLAHGAWVGVGSVCKRNASPDAIAAVVGPLARERPDLRFHGFGVKLTSLGDARVRALFWSTDSLAWSFDARMTMLKHGTGYGANDVRSALAYAARIDAQRPPQPDLFPAW